MNKQGSDLHQNFKQQTVIPPNVTWQNMKTISSVAIKPFESITCLI